LVYIYAGYRKNGGTNTKSAFQNYLITKILSSPSLRIYQETDEGLLYGSYNDKNTRQALGSAAPINGPFIENYSYAGDLNLDNFINFVIIMNFILHSSLW
jgi:hypothetical protein